MHLGMKRRVKGASPAPAAPATPAIVHALPAASAAQASAQPAVTGLRNDDDTDVDGDDRPGSALAGGGASASVAQVKRKYTRSLGLR